jgi:long-chain acyl-CoA synthetase
VGYSRSLYLDANTLHTICFTCGTTGNPRGVMLTHRNIVSAMSSLLSIYMPGKGPNQHDIYMSYLPLCKLTVYVMVTYDLLLLAHVFEHTLAMAMLSVGGAIATHTGNPRTMSELACEVRPTILPV